MAYIIPGRTTYVSCSWQCHRNRNPPSSEPGTDYADSYGTPLRAVGSGTINEVKTSNSGAMGRVCGIALDDGRSTRSLHMSSVSARVGQRVRQGDQIGLSGASGYGSDWYYGPHIHQTLWPHAPWANPTIDFALYVGSAPGPTPTPPPDDNEEEEVTLRMMHWRGGSVINPATTASALRRAIWDSSSGYWSEWSEGDGATFANRMASNWQTGSSAEVTQSLANSIYQQCLRVAPGKSSSTAAMSAPEVDAE